MTTGKKYNSSGAFQYDLFRGQAADADGVPITRFKDLVLRNSGGDFYSTMLRDAFLQSLVMPVYDVLQAYRPCILFIDGEYWGLHNIRERYSEAYFAQHFHVKEKSLAILKYFGTDPDIVAGTEQDKQDFLDLGTYAAEHDLSVQAHYDYVAQRVDLDGLARYFAIQMYFDNDDFLANNVRVWRAKDPKSPYGDGKWRFALYDLDLAMLTEPTMDTPARVMDDDPKLPHYAYVDIFRELMRNDSFKALFLKTMYAFLDTVFEPEAACALLDDMVAAIEPEMREHCARWSLERGFIGKILERFGGSKTEDLYAKWQEAVTELRARVEARPQEMRDWLDDTFGADALKAENS